MNVVVLVSLVLIVICPFLLWLTVLLLSLLLLVVPIILFGGVALEWIVLVHSIFLFRDWDRDWVGGVFVLFVFVLLVLPCVILLLLLSKSKSDRKEKKSVGK